MYRFLLAIVFAVVLSLAGRAHGALYGAQPGSGKIVEIDPVTGAILRGFAAPDPSFNLVGLSGAEGGSVLIYQNTNGETSQTRITRINPLSGSVLDYHTPLTATGVRGLTAQNVGGTQYLINAGSDALIQHGYDSTQYDVLNYGSGTARALGGDDRGRSFVETFEQTVWTIREFSPASNSVLNSYSSPSGVTGLAFDGQYLYAAANEAQGSDLVSRIYTLDPSNGAIVRSVLLQGSLVNELAVALPEPSYALILAAVCAGFCRLRFSASSHPRKARTSGM